MLAFSSVVVGFTTEDAEGFTEESRREPVRYAAGHTQRKRMRNREVAAQPIRG